MDEMRRPSSLDEDDDEGVRNTRNDEDDGPGEIQGDIIVKFNNISFDVRCARVLMGWQISCDKSESGVAFRRRR